MTTFAELLAPPTVDQIAEYLIAKLKAAKDANGNNPFTVNDWASGSFPRTFVDMAAAGIYEYAAKLQPYIAGGGYLEEAVDEWATIFAKQMFNLDRDLATQTHQNVQLWFDPLVGPVTKAAGFFVVESGTGNLYRNVSPVTVPLGDGTDATKVNVDFIAESPGAKYSDGPLTIKKLVTPLPGLNCLNPTRDYPSPIKQVGISEATITPFRTAIGTAPTPCSVRIVITATGLVGAGSLTYELNSDPRTLRAVTPIPATLALLDAAGALTGTSLTLNDFVGTKTFITGSIFSFDTPISPITVQGRDDETTEALMLRCQARWPDLADVPTSDRHANWVRTVSREQGLGITKVKTYASKTVAGRAEILIGGDSNPLPTGTRDTAQAYVDARLGITDLALVTSATPVAVTSIGTVRVAATQMAATKAKADAAWAAYIALLPIGGEPLLGGIVSLDTLVQTLKNAGALQVSGESMSGSPGRTNDADGNLVLLFNDVAGVASPLSTSMTWLAV